MKILKFAVNPFLFFISLAAFSASVYSIGPPPADLGTRFIRFTEIKDEVTILFLGSSFTYRQIIPSVINETMAQRGHIHRAFNLGAVAGTNHENNALLTRVLKSKPKNLRYVVIEPRGWHVAGATSDATHRFVWWHDPAETMSVLRTVRLAVRDPGERLQLIRSHLGAMSIRCLSIGKFTDRPDRKDEPKSLDGWVSYEETGERGGTLLLEQSLRDYLDAPGHKPDVSTYNLEALRDQATRLDGSGIEIVYLLPPSLKPYAKIRRFHRMGIIPRLIDLSSPLEYPELFELKNRHDPIHLNTRGSTIYSRMVAEELLALTSERER